VRVFGRYRNPGTVDVTLHANVSGQPIATQTSLDFPARKDKAAQSPEIERMWAWTRIDRLLKSADAVGARGEAVEEIVRLGEGYSIMSEFTSFIVLENDGEYKRWNIERKNNVRISRDRSERTKLNDRLLKMQEAALLKIGPPAPPTPPTSEGTPTAKPPVPQLAQVDRPAPGSGDIDLRERRSRPSWGAGGGGGGAIDPVTASLAGLLILGVVADRVRRRRMGKAS
jgi:Ca-activated chloride channel family protein